MLIIGTKPQRASPATQLRVESNTRLRSSSMTFYVWSSNRLAIHDCGPDPSDIWNFAHGIVSTLNDFIVDALSLGNEDLEGYRSNAIRSLRTSFWISLGTSDEEKKIKKEKKRKKARKNSTICWSKKLSTAAESPVSQKHSRMSVNIASTKENLCLQRNTRLCRSDLVERTRQVGRSQNGRGKRYTEVKFDPVAVLFDPDA
ncbi:unnamed protein product [Cylicocyclus nassatus]|uniref:Uncharacterized protein n=1 Tax=Cylicocyclus nassatus TaxID=53992 RepID=A0AA36HH52_CYLNA|nr:unnamed protein product [Cylicocyclus nassatus]